MTNKLVVGLASFGMSGRIFHAPFIEKNPHYELKYILERSKSNSKKLYPKATITRSFDTLVKIPEIDIIVINTPTYLHFEMAKTALLAGKHVVLEKPMTATSSEAKELIRIAQEHKLTLAVYHNKRFEGNFKTLQKLIASKKLGALLSCHLSVHRFRPEIGPKKWKEDTFSGAGILYDIGSHLIDQCLVLFGWPDAIDADLQIQRVDGKVIDYFKVDLIYGEFRATIISDMLTKTSKPTISVKGSNATFVKYGHDPQESRLASGSINWDTLGVDSEEFYGTLTYRGSEPSERIQTEIGFFGEFYTNLYEALNSNKPLIIAPYQALKVIELIEWILESPVKINTVI
jgi:predicted dehydrogenase